MAVSMLLCMSMVAFADPAYNVTTTYDGVNNVTVTTNVTGAVASEQVAFLVEKGANIVWIDQKAADNSGAASSVFTDTVADAVGATVKVGTASLAANTFGEAKSIALPNYTVTWAIQSANNSKVFAVVNEIEDADGTTSTAHTVTFYVAPAANEVLASVTYGETTDTSFVGDSKSYVVTGNTAFTFTFAEKNVASAPAPEVAENPEVVPPAAEAAVKTASVTATATDAVEYGLLVAVKGTADLTTVTAADLNTLGVATAPIRKYPALGANGAGQFVIQLKDTDNVFFVGETKYEACVYAYGSDLTLGEVFDLN